MPLLKGGRIVEDPWTTIEDDAPLPDAGPILVSLSRWRSEREHLLARPGGCGVRLVSEQLAGEIGEDSRHLAVIAIAFPTFRDGRPYSTARLLRERYHFAGELRATGDVLRDQFSFMARCGFDAFEVTDEKAAAAWGAAMHEMSAVYQPASDGRQSVPALRHQPRAAA